MAGNDKSKANMNRKWIATDSTRRNHEAIFGKREPKIKKDTRMKTLVDRVKSGETITGEDVMYLRKIGLHEIADLAKLEG